MRDMYKSVRKKKSSEFVPDRNEGLATLAMIQGDINRSVALNAGNKSRDPVWHLTESFATVFNRAGRSLTGQTAETAEYDGTGLKSRGENETEAESQQQGKEWSFSKHYETSPLQKQSGLFLRKFGQTAFDGGNLAAGILQGQSRYMLMSCLKRSLGQSEPKNARQEKLFGGASVHKNLPLRDAQVVFNRNDIKSAVGVVVSSLQSAVRVFDTLERAAESEDSPVVQENVETLRQLYPFLTIDRDRKTLDKYREKLAVLKEQGAGEELVSVLERRIAKLQSVVDKKMEMKTRFMTKLREYSDNAVGAEKLFTQPGFIEQVYEELSEYAAGSGEDGDDNQKNRRGEHGQTTQAAVNEERSDEQAPAG